MLKKLFAVAGLAAVGVLMSTAGCSSSSNPADDGAGDGGGVVDAGKRDSSTGNPTVDDDGGGTTNANCPRPASKDDVTINPPNARKNACNQAALTFIDNKIKNAPDGYTFQQFKTDVTANDAACGACVFSSENDAKWGPIVFVGDQGGAFYFRGGCVQRSTTPEAPDSCSVGYQRANFCLEEVCQEADCGSSQAAISACVQSTIRDTTNGCGRHSIDSCGQTVAAAENFCLSSLQNLITAFCTTTPVGGDGGADGGDGG